LPAPIGVIQMNSTPSRTSLLALKRHALIVFLICYVPLAMTQPAWLFILFSAIVGYGLLEDYYSAPPTRWWVHLMLIIGCLFLLGRTIFISGFFIRFFLAFIILKYLEVRSIRDIKIIILCNFFVILSALVVTQELWIILYLLVAIAANFSIMLKLSAPEVSFNQISSKNGLQLLIIIPLSLLLFYVFPRINPLWQMPSLEKSKISLSDKMTPGSIADLFDDDRTAMQITFTNNNPVLNGYWRAVILNYYTGETWYLGIYKYSSFQTLNELKENELPDYEILLEPTQIRWLPYLDNPVAARTDLIFDPNHGLIRENKRPITERFSYSIKAQLQPYQALNSTDYAEATQLPNLNPRLRDWAKEQFEKANKDPAAFIAFLRQYIHEQPFWYSLQPPGLNANINQMDTFWFDTQKGFCEHYASAVTFILRATGIPARVVLGYHGGQWNPITHSITIQQHRAHAWIEYWQEGAGWQLLDPTFFIARERIDKNIQARQQEQLNQAFSISATSWGRGIIFMLDSVRFYSERWFLFYNQNTQKNLLQYVGLGNWDTYQLLQISVVSIPLFFFLIGLYYSWWQRRRLDPLLHEYHLLQNEFRKLNIATPPSATLNQQCTTLVSKVPALSHVLSSFIYRYEELRLKQVQGDDKPNKRETILLFKKLRKVLRGMRVVGILTG
jgi:transglutaminase-like putative cysteine protease